MTPDASGGQTATETNDVRQHAAGNLAFLLSVIRCGEQLSPDEEAVIRKTIARLTEAASASLDREGLADKLARLKIWRFVHHRADCPQQDAPDSCTCGLLEAELEIAAALRSAPSADREGLAAARPEVITNLLAVDDTGVVANYIRKLEAALRAAPRSEGEQRGVGGRHNRPAPPRKAGA